GTPGTNELQVSHNGTQILFSNPVTSGTWKFTSSGLSSAMLFESTSNIDFGDATPQVNIRMSGQTLKLGSGGKYTWSSGADSATGDTGIGRLVAGVIGCNDASSGNGWIQNTAGEGVLNAPFTENAASLTNTNLSFTVISGRSYRITGTLQVSNSQAAEG